ncbi:hypothetical protein K438DRAFT_1808022 [Mycena galopus ATCC 62051]|nr:hypothetical protein K438DRAFT_1808022 [Mycena galopus ATCC 62051]
MAASRCFKCGSFPLSPLNPFDISVPPGTRHYNLLNSNEPPDDSDSTFIHSVVSDADARLARLDDEIAKIREHLHQLEEERASLSTFQTRNKAIISPLRRMPPELLSEIFSWTLPSISESLEREEYMAEGPWTVSHTNTCWRVVSLSTPSLWSQITAQIQRAEELKIHFYGSERADSGSQIQIFQLLSQHSSRWKELGLGLTSQIVPLLTALQDRVPSLKRVWIHDQRDRQESQAAVQSINCFQSAPSLLDFGVSAKHGFIPMKAPVHQLTRFQFRGPWEWHKGVLRLTQRLLQASIVIDDGEFGEDTDEIINLSHLRKLYISDPAALSALRAPALQELSFWFDPDQPDILLHLETFVGRSACRLRRLCLTGSPDSSTTLEILQKIPSIDELVISTDEPKREVRQNTDTLMEALTVSNLAGATVIAPHLSLMLFACKKETCFNYAAYLRMVQSRWQAAGCALKTAVLLVHLGPLPDPAILYGLHALREEGLDFVFLQGPAAVQEISEMYAPIWIF